VSEVVLDASAVLALLNEETGTEVVEEALPGALIGAVNLSEVLSKLAEFGMSNDDAWSAITGLGLEIVAFDVETARIAASLRRATRSYGLSLGDRACLALGVQRGALVLTADRAWLALDEPALKIRAIR
jgi:ribonuclease VapC